MREKEREERERGEREEKREKKEISVGGNRKPQGYFLSSPSLFAEGEIESSIFLATKHHSR